LRERKPTKRKKRREIDILEYKKTKSEVILSKSGYKEPARGKKKISPRNRDWKRLDRDRRDEQRVHGGKKQRLSLKTRN